MLPASEERVFILNFVSAGGEMVGAREFKIYAGPPLVRRSRRWRCTQPSDVFDGSKTKLNPG